MRRSRRVRARRTIPSTPRQPYRFLLRIELPQDVLGECQGQRADEGACRQIVDGPELEQELRRVLENESWRIDGADELLESAEIGCSEHKHIPATPPIPDASHVCR